VNDCDPEVERQALIGARGYFATLAPLPDRSLTHCSLHWSATPYRWANDCIAVGTTLPYHIVAGENAGGNATLFPGLSPALNARELTDLHEANVDYCASVYRRNSRGVAASMSAMAGAIPADFGTAPITPALIEFMCAGAAALCAAYGIDARDPQACYTHAEAAIWDGYFLGDEDDSRWDLAILEPYAGDIASLKRLVPATGDRLRARIHAYRQKLA
jgi:hypothetical protein